MKLNCIWLGIVSQFDLKKLNCIWLGIVSQFDLKKELSYKISFLYLIRDPKKLQIYSLISSGCGQTCPK